MCFQSCHIMLRLGLQHLLLELRSCIKKTLPWEPTKSDFSSSDLKSISKQTYCYVQVQLNFHPAAAMQSVLSDPGSVIWPLFPTARLTLSAKYPCLWRRFMLSGFLLRRKHSHALNSAGQVRLTRRRTWQNRRELIRPRLFTVRDNITQFMPSGFSSVVPPDTQIQGS